MFVNVSLLFSGWLYATVIFLPAPQAPAHALLDEMGAPAVRLNYQQINPAQFPKIVSYVSVLNDSGRSIDGLTKDNFIVHEDGVRELPIIVEALVDDATGVSVVLVLDRSGSMEGTPLADVKKAATTFVQLMNNHDQAALVSFSYFPTIDHAMSNNKASLINAINAMVSNGGTAIYDAVIQAADVIAPVSGNRAIILLTDGADNASQATFRDAFNKVAPMNMPIFTIGLGPNVGSKEERNLRQLADSTYGRYFYSPTSAELESIYREISRLLHLMYRITYTTHNCTMDSTLRNVRIDVQYRGLTSYGTKTYRAPGYFVTMAPASVEVPEPGDTFRLRVEIPARSNEVLDLAEMRFVLNYNAQYLKPKTPLAQAVTVGSLLGAPGEYTVTASNSAPGALMIHVKRHPGLPPVKGRGIVAEISFVADPAMPDSTKLNFKLTDLDPRTEAGCQVAMRVEESTIYSAGLVVWPGDTNHNGKVELTDVLVLGLYWNMTGPARRGPENQIAWMPHVASRYAIREATHADADGSGGIIERDLIPIGLNWGKTAASISIPKVAITPATLPEGEMRVAIAPTEKHGQYRLQLWFESANHAELAGVMFRLVYSSAQMKILSAGPGSIWLEQPLVVTHDDARTFAMGIMMPAGAPLPTNNGKLAEIFVQAEDVSALSDFSFENVALVAADGQLREMELKTGVATTADFLPETFAFYPAYPNPISASAGNLLTAWRYYLPERATVKVAIYNIFGQQIREFAPEEASLGYHTLSWDGTDAQGRRIGSGIYFVAMEAVGQSNKIHRTTQKIVVVK